MALANGLRLIQLRDKTLPDEVRLHLARATVRRAHLHGARVLVNGPLELAHAAALGADFALLSPVLPTLTHPGAATLGWEAFSALAAVSPIPVYGLGGLGRDDVALAQSHGAHGVALLRGAWT